MAKSIEPKLRKIGAYLQLEEDTIFTIPEYQRPYSWSVGNCESLIGVRMILKTQPLWQVIE